MTITHSAAIAFIAVGLSGAIFPRLGWLGWLCLAVAGALVLLGVQS